MKPISAVRVAKAAGVDLVEAGEGGVGVAGGDAVLAVGGIVARWIDLQELALGVVEGLGAGGERGAVAVADADVEQAVGSELDLLDAVEIGDEADPQQLPARPREGVGARHCGCPLGDDAMDGVAELVGEVRRVRGERGAVFRVRRVEAAVGREVGIERHPREARAEALTRREVGMAGGDVEECARRAAVDHEDLAPQVGDEQPTASVAAVGRAVDAGERAAAGGRDGGDVLEADLEAGHRDGAGDRVGDRRVRGRVGAGGCGRTRV
jgi:hypothetical protein